jgi:hypothetical protein
LILHFFNAKTAMMQRAQRKYRSLLRSGSDIFLNV